MNPSTLLLSMTFGTIGVGYFIYGRKQQKSMPLLVGVLLMVFPYFVSNVLISILIGCCLMALPWFIES